MGKTYFYGTEEEAKQVIAYSSYIEKNGFKLRWQDRGLKTVLEKMEEGDTLAVSSYESLACSTSQILEIFNIVMGKEVNILINHSIKVHKCVEIQELIQLLSRIESNFVSKRTTQALARRREAGLPLGRPKGKKNKSLKLDRHAEDIHKYLNLGVSKASIAKIVGCHPQTLYDWVERSGLLEEQQ